MKLIFERCDKSLKVVMSFRLFINQHTITKKNSIESFMLGRNRKILKNTSKLKTFRTEDMKFFIFSLFVFTIEITLLQNFDLASAINGLYK